MVLRRITAKRDNWKDKAIGAAGRIPTLYYWSYIIDLVIANYRRIKIVKIKHYGKDKKDNFNFYGKSRENLAAVVTSASSNDYRGIEEKRIVGNSGKCRKR